MPMLVNPVQIQLPAEGFVRTHAGKIQWHNPLFERGLIMNGKGGTTGRPRNNTLQALSGHLF